MQTTRGRGFGGRGRGGRGRGGGNFNPRHLKQSDTDVLCDVEGCGVYARDLNGLALHRAAKHGAQLQTKDGTVSNYVSTVNNQIRNPPGTGRRAIARQRQNQQVFVPPTDGAFSQQPVASGSRPSRPSDATVGYTPAPPLWVASSTGAHIRQDRTLPSRASLISGSEIHLVPRAPFTIGNGTGNQLNVLQAVHWQGFDLNGTTVTVPYPVAEFIGLDIQVHGDFGSHGDFAMVYMSHPSGSAGLSADNATRGTADVPRPSLRRDTLVSLRFSPSLSRHTVITGSGNFFVPVLGSGALIQGAGHVNVISGTSVLAPNAAIVTVVMSAVYRVSGNRA